MNLRDLVLRINVALLTDLVIIQTGLRTKNKVRLILSEVTLPDSMPHPVSPVSPVDQHRLLKARRCVIFA